MDGIDSLPLATCFTELTIIIDLLAHPAFILLQSFISVSQTIQ